MARALATEIDDKPDARELDLLMSTGELVSANLVTVALQSKGLKARPFTGAKAGIANDCKHASAKIRAIQPSFIERCLDRGYIPVVSGFQGLSDDGEVTTLGRGGSDTTAVALAAALKAERCDIYTDVDGVYDVDPRQSNMARKLNFISYDEIESGTG